MNLSLTKQPWYVQLGAFCALSLLAIVAFYFGYASRTQADADAQAQKLQGLRVEIDKGHITERRLPQFEKDARALEARLESLKAVLPEEKDVGDLISRMAQLAVQSNLRIVSIHPRPATARGLYTELPSEVQLDGTYHNFGLFLDRLSKLTRIINVSDISIKGKDRPDATSSVTATCIATTYVLIDPTKVPAAPPKK